MQNDQFYSNYIITKPINYYHNWNKSLLPDTINCLTFLLILCISTMIKKKCRKEIFELIAKIVYLYVCITPKTIVIQ